MATSHKIEIYTITYCPFCIRAKELLNEKGLSYQEINLDEQPQRREEMQQRAGGRSSVPQIFIDGNHLGGCDDMLALNQSGELDGLLA